MGAGVGGTTASGECIVRTGEGVTKPGHSLSVRLMDGFGIACHGKSL